MEQVPINLCQKLGDIFVILWKKKRFAIVYVYVCVCVHHTGLMCQCLIRILAKERITGAVWKIINPKKSPRSSSDN